MAELKSAMGRIQANELRALHKGGMGEGEDGEDEGACAGAML